MNRQSDPQIEMSDFQREIIRNLIQNKNADRCVLKKPSGSIGKSDLSSLPIKKVILDEYDLSDDELLDMVEQSDSEESVFENIFEETEEEEDNE